MSKSKSEIKRQVIKTLNEKYGKDLLDPNKCRELQKKYQSRKDFLLRELDLKAESSCMSKLTGNVDGCVRKVEGLLDESKSVDEEIKGQLNKVEEIRRTVQIYCDKMNILESTIQYMKVIQRIEALSVELQREIANKDDEKCATLFANLCEISRNLTGSRAGNLSHFLRDTLHHWHNILKDKFAGDYEEVLKAIKWPFVNTNFSLQTPSQANITKLQVIAEYLLQIELPEESAKAVITSALLSHFPPLSLPVHFLVSPLRKRFLYHFHGTRQTNRVDKPEWYLTQILSWIRDHVEFVQEWIQPIINKLGLHHIDARLELMRGLVQLAVEKLYLDLPNLQYDDFTFSHSVDEALGFDKELRETFDYPPTQPSILAVLTQGQIFVKWMALEKKYATEKLDAMLSLSVSDAFQPVLMEQRSAEQRSADQRSADSDESKQTVCADTFITLLQTMTERYESLPQPGHRLQFLELQLELLDDFRVRLLQLTNAESGDIIESRIPMIANTIYYVENVLVDWGTMLHYLNLYYYKSQLENMDFVQPRIPDFDEVIEREGDEQLRFGESHLGESHLGESHLGESHLIDSNGESNFGESNLGESNTIFSDTLSLYRHMRKDLLCTLAETVVMEAKARSRTYRNERWSSMTSQKDLRSFSLTPSACPIFEVLATRLHQLQKNLAGKLFTIVWRYIAQQLDTFLFEDLVLDNRFNEGGAMQLKYDVTRNLFALFSQFSEKPDHYFVQLNEACNLLNISKGSALLLRETLLALEGATGVEDRRGQALAEIGVVSFTPKMAVTILNQRADITLNRLSID